MGHYEKLFIRFVTVIRLCFIIIANPPFNYFTLLNIGREANNASLQHLHLTIFQKTRKKTFFKKQEKSIDRKKKL